MMRPDSSPGDVRGVRALRWTAHSAPDQRCVPELEEEEVQRNSEPPRGVILVACPDEDARRICRHCLEFAGYVVHETASADAIVDLAHATRPDLIVTSYPTYGSDGVSVAARVRRDAALARTPLLNLASWTRQEDLEDAAAEGVDESLPMPVALDLLLRTVERLAGGGSARGPVRASWDRPVRRAGAARADGPQRDGRADAALE